MTSWTVVYDESINRNERHKDKRREDTISRKMYNHDTTIINKKKSK